MSLTLKRSKVLVWQQQKIVHHKFLDYLSAFVANVNQMSIDSWRIVVGEEFRNIFQSLVT